VAAARRASPGTPGARATGARPRLRPRCARQRSWPATGRHQDRRDDGDLHAHPFGAHPSGTAQVGRSTRSRGRFPRARAISPDGRLEPSGASHDLVKCAEAAAVGCCSRAAPGPVRYLRTSTEPGLIGGAEGIRTPDPLDANEVRYRTAPQPRTSRTATDVAGPTRRITGLRRRAVGRRSARPPLRCRGQ
jgi:hypothetical protein